jgi:UDP-glucose 4-epimerase
MVKCQDTKRGFLENILVTGGAGFIGSNLVDHIARSFPDSNIVVIDRNPLTWKASKEGRSVQGITVDLEDHIELCSQLNILKNSRLHVFHLAAQTSAEISMHRPLLDVTTNLLGLANLLEAFAINNVAVEHFVFTSSMAVYGHQSNADQSGFSAANTRPNPVSVYGATKLMSEKYLRSLNLPLSIVRLFNVYGPGQDYSNMMQGMVSIYVAQLVREQRITVKGAMDRTRDLCYVDDVSSSLLKIGLNPPDNNENQQLLNLGTGVATSITTLTQKILDQYETVTGFRGDVATTEGTAGDMPYSFDADSGILKFSQNPTDLATGLRNIIQDAIIKLS